MCRPEHDLADGLRLLEGVRDGAFSFDDPAFYWFCGFVRRERDAGTAGVSDSDFPVPWRFLLERPSDYRGRLLVVEGVLRSRPRFIQTAPGRGDLGQLTQCELSESGTRSFCTVICIDDAADVPIRSRVRARGYFIKVRGYSTNTGETGAGPLIVARRLELVQPPASGLANGFLHGVSGTTLLISATALLAVVWLLLRRHLRAVPNSAARPRFDARGRTDQAEDDFAWLQEQPPRDGCDEGH